MDPNPGGMLTTDPPDPDPQHCQKNEKTDKWPTQDYHQNKEDKMRRGAYI
jgi:hypothetical protein